MLSTGSALGDALSGGLQHLQDLLDQALGGPTGGPPPPQPDAQPDDQPGANETPTPPPPDLQDWGDDQAPPAPPDTSPPPAEPPPPLTDPDLTGMQPPPAVDPYFNPGDQQGGPPDIGPPAPPDIGPPAPTDLGGGGGGGIGSDAAATGGAGAYTPPTWSDFLGNALTGFGNLLVPPANAGFETRVYVYPSQPGDPTSGNPYAPPNTTGETTQLPSITVSPDETPPTETDRLGPTREGTATESQGTGGPDTPLQDQFFNPSDQQFPNQAPPDQPTTGSSPDWTAGIPMPPGVNDLVANPPTAADYGGYGAGAAAAAAAAGLIGAGVGGIGGGGGYSGGGDTGGAGFGPWSASPGGSSGGNAGDTGNIVSDVNPNAFVEPGQQEAQNRPRQQQPQVPTDPNAPQAPREPIPPGHYPTYRDPVPHGWQPAPVAPQHQSDLDYLEQHGGHNTVMPPNVQSYPRDSRGLEQNAPPSQQSPGYQLMQPEFARRLAAAGEAYTRATGREPVYGRPPGTNGPNDPGNAGEMSRGDDVQTYYWDTNGRQLHGPRGTVGPPHTVAGARGSVHREGRAMDVASGGFRDWLYQTNPRTGNLNVTDFGLRFSVSGNNPRGNDAGHVVMSGQPTANVAAAPRPPGNVLGGPAPPTGYQYGGQRPMVPQDPSLTEPYGPAAPPPPPPPPTAQERRDAAELARANREAIRRGLMNPDGTPGPNALRMPQPRPEGAPTTDRYFNPGDFAGVPPTPLPQPRPAGAPSVPYSGGGIGSDAARAPDQGQARDQYFNPGDYQGGPYPSAADALAAEAARRARAALESGQVPMGYDYGGNRPMMPQEPPNYPMGYDYGGNRPTPPLTDPDLTGMQPQPQYVPNRPYDPSMDRPLPGNPYTDPQSMGYDYGINRPPYPWTRTETSDGTVVDPRKLVDPSKATEETKVPTPPPSKTAPAPAPRTAPRPAPRYVPRPAPITRPPVYMQENTPGYAAGYSGGGFNVQQGAIQGAPIQGMLGSGTYFVPGSNLIYRRRR